VRALAIIIAIEILVLVVLVFGDIGFDHPGRYGLDIGDGIALTLLLCTVLVAGVAYALRQHHWVIALLQVLLPVVIILGIELAPRLSRPLDPADYQFLVGKSKAEVAEALDGRRPFPTGFVSDENGEREFASFKGMTVYYSMDGKVLSVEAQ